MEKQQQGQRSTPREGEGEVVRDGGPTLGTVSGEALGPSDARPGDARATDDAFRAAVDAAEVR